MRNNSMNRRIKLSASLICANLLNLEQDLKIIHHKGFDYIHFDIMDGHFVPRIGLGIFFLKELTKNQPIPVEVHLMVSDPQMFIDEIAHAGASIITFHYETGKDIYHIIQKIKKHHLKVGIALSPCTPFSLILPFIEYLDLVLLMAYSPGILGQEPILNFEERIGELNAILHRCNQEHIDIAIDGGISEDNIRNFKEKGANFFILGSSGLFIPGRKLSDQIDRINSLINHN
jgi:ribulose-phosphate 3-epimerase